MPTIPITRVHLWRPSTGSKLTVTTCRVRTQAKWIAHVAEQFPGWAFLGCVTSVESIDGGK